MSEESIHDIIREMMNCTAVKSKVPHSTVEDILNPPIIRFNLEQRTIVRDFAYRIAAAAERERAISGGWHVDDILAPRCSKCKKYAWNRWKAKQNRRNKK